MTFEYNSKTKVHILDWFEILQFKYSTEILSSHFITTFICTYDLELDKRHLKMSSCSTRPWIRTQDCQTVDSPILTYSYNRQLEKSKTDFPQKSFNLLVYNYSLIFFILALNWICFIYFGYSEKYINFFLFFVSQILSTLQSCLTRLQIPNISRISREIQWREPLPMVVELSLINRSF